MHALILAMLVGLTPYDQVATDRADIIELNHFFDENGKLVFHQVIFWRWWDEKGEFHVVAWRFVKSPGIEPVRDWPRRGYVSIWIDGNVLRRVRSRSSRETWTQYDPEVHDRQFLSQNRRRGLASRPHSKKARPEIAPPHH